MATSNMQHAVQHLAWRAGFGPSVKELNRLRNLDVKDYLKLLFANSSKKPAYLEAIRNPYTGPPGTNYAKQMQALSEKERIEFRKRLRESTKELNRIWMNEMIHSSAQLREKMAFFWHGHFACRSTNVIHHQLLLQEVRTHALGKFPDLLLAVSKSAAMINFLNNNQNRKNHPNENFAREVMELFTIGKGNYTEEDISEAARAFTGWGANSDGSFVFRASQHDKGVKKIFGKTGNFSGEEVLKMLLENKATARHLVEKIYRFFVNEDLNEKIVVSLADEFYASGYDIGKLMMKIFSSDWFYHPENIGTKIKSPIELWVGINRQIPMEVKNHNAVYFFHYILEHVLFFPPNVAGWPTGKAWIDSSSLLYRLKLPMVLNAEAEINVQPKADDDVQMGEPVGPLRGLVATMKWNEFLPAFSKVPMDDLPKALSDFLLQTTSKPPENVLRRYTRETSRENFVSSRTLLLMQSPEYQYC